MDLQTQAKQPEVLDKAALGDIKGQLRKVPRTNVVPTSKVPTTTFQFPALRSVSDLKRRTDEQKSVKQLQHSQSLQESTEANPYADIHVGKASKTTEDIRSRQDQFQSSSVHPSSSKSKASANKSEFDSNDGTKEREFISLYVRNENPKPNYAASFLQENSSTTVSGVRSSSANARSNLKEASPTITVTEYGRPDLQSTVDNGFATIPRTSRRQDSSKLMSQKILQQLNTAVQRHNSIQASAITTFPLHKDIITSTKAIHLLSKRTWTQWTIIRCVVSEI